jgi:hypothetical protein
VKVATLRSLRGRIGGLALASQRDPREYTSAARAAFLRTFEAEVDPSGVLPAAERTRRALAARKLHFARLALASVKARRRKAGQRE